FFYILRRPPPQSTLFPYTTLFRSPQVTLPKQYVRLRILNAEMERGYNLGFSDNRTFYIIANDGGLLNAPVSATRIKLLVGERARSEEHTSELQSRGHLVCRLLLEK